MTLQNLFSFWLFINIIIGFVIYSALKGSFYKRRTNIAIIITILCTFLIYIYPLLIIFITWKYPLPKKTIITYFFNFGPSYDVGKDSVIWKNMAGFDKTWVLDERVAHSHPMDHIDFVYSTIKVPGIKPKDVCIIAQATGSIFIDMLKEEATARCHYLVKNAVSLGFVQDVVAGKIGMKDSREEYGKRILNNIYPSWFKDPLNEAHKTLGEGAHHLVLSGKKHEHI